MRKLVIAWIVTLGFFVGVITWLQITYEPESGAGKTLTALSGTAAEQKSPGVGGEDIGPMPTLEAGPPTPPGAQGIEQPGVDAPAADPAGQIPPETGNQGSFGAAADEDNLTEEGPHGPLPVTKGGRQPWRVHARAYSGDPETPKIAIIISGLGLNRRTTEESINSLPPDVTLAFSPYGQELEALTTEAQAAGHETLIMIPMEPLDYPVNDPGPHSLLTSLPTAQNIDHLHYVMSRFQGYVGLINDMGSRFTASEEALRPVMADLQRRGVLFVDARTTGATIIAAVARSFGVPVVSNSRYIDNIAAGSEIDRYLAELEEIAQARGRAIGIGRAYPVTISRIDAWSGTLAERGIDLVPITAIVRHGAAAGEGP